MCGIFAAHISKQQKGLDKMVECFQLLANRGPDSGVLNIYNNIIFT